MAARKNKLVYKKNRIAHLRILLSIIMSSQMREARVRPKTVGVTLGDICDLAQLVWPKRDWWWSEFLVEVPKQLRPILLKQHPGLAKVSVKGLNNANFEVWLTKQTKRYGEWFSITRHKAKRA